MKLKLEVRENKPLNNGQVNGSLAVTPPISEDFWLLRVKVSEKQAVVAFPKFFTIGIGFQHEEKDWNTNLPYSSSTEEIYNHIKINKLGADKKTCLKAIKMIQDAAKELDTKE